MTSAHTLVEPAPEVSVVIPVCNEQDNVLPLAREIHAALDRLESVVPAVQQLGVRHVGYGVKDEHYDTVGAALLWTLEQGLGDGFTSEVKDAWATVYGVLAGTMKSAAAEAAA